MKTTHVSMRLSHDVWARYSKDADAQGLALGTLLRRRLEEQDRYLVGELAALRRVVEEAAAATPASGTAPFPPSEGTLVEVLLLLRTLVGPQNAALVQREVERRGLEVWR